MLWKLAFRSRVLCNGLAGSSVGFGAGVIELGEVITLGSIDLAIFFFLDLTFGHLLPAIVECGILTPSISWRAIATSSGLLLFFGEYPVNLFRFVGDRKRFYIFILLIIIP